MSGEEASEEGKLPAGVTPLKEKASSKMVEKKSLSIPHGIDC